MSLERLLTIVELSRETGMPQGEIKAAIADGDLPFMQRRPRTRIRIAESDFVAWRERHTRQACVRRATTFTAPDPERVSQRSIDHLFSPTYVRRFSSDRVR